MISVPSNNATFGRSEMTYQQLAMSRVRAVEHSRTVIVPVTSGVSAVITPGRHDRQTGRACSPPTRWSPKVPLRSSLTPATRLGHRCPEALALLAAAGLGWAGIVGGTGARGSAGTHAVRPGPAT